MPSKEALMHINWKVRIKHEGFWIAIIPMIFLLVQQVLGIFGITISFENVQEQLIAVIGTIFAILGILGIVTDPTTKGLSDSEDALNYKAPRED